jgi:hypothetical protein
MSYRIISQVRTWLRHTGDINFVSKMAVFWDIAPCRLAETDRRFRCAYCLHHQGDQETVIFILVAVRTWNLSKSAETESLWHDILIRHILISWTERRWIKCWCCAVSNPGCHLQMSTRQVATVINSFVSWYGYPNSILLVSGGCVCTLFTLCWVESGRNMPWPTSRHSAHDFTWHKPVAHKSATTPLDCP